MRLLALTHEHEYPLAKTLSDLFGSLEKPLRNDLGVDQVEAAQAAGETHLDLDVLMRRSDTTKVEHLIELLDLADAFCREERLLSLARSPEQIAFQKWFLGEVVSQSRAELPIAWTGTDESTIRRTSVS